MRRLFACLLLCWSCQGMAAIDVYEFDSLEQEQRYRHLIEELRCPKCQNQNIADSNAPIATDLRREIYRMLDDGRSDKEIVDFLVMRYGDFVMYKPPLDSRTWLLWYGPFGLLGLGAIVLCVLVLRRRKVEKAPAQVALSKAERERLDALLKENRDTQD